MAERKTTARKGPTRAAALKALGLTAAELADLKSAAKELAALKSQQPAQNAPAPECTCGPNEACSNCPTQEVTASANLTPGNGFGGQDPQAALEDRQAPQPQAVAGPEPDPVWYVRNLRHVEVSFRLTRQQDSSKKRTALKPRGARGDMQRLEDGDLRDPELQTQVQFGLVEVIPEGEARVAIQKQYTNQQTEVPAHIAMLRNPKGEEYKQANPVKMASDLEAYGKTVAHLDPALMQGNLSDKEIKRGGGFVQDAQRTPTGGNPAIISDGFMAPTQGDSQLGATDEHSRNVDALARSKQFEGPGAGLGEVTVKVMPTQRVE